MNEKICNNTAKKYKATTKLILELIKYSRKFYFSYSNWYNSSNPLKKQPKLWKMVSSRAQRMFKKLVEPRQEKRATNFSELTRYLDDRWLAKGYTDRVGKLFF